MNYTLYIYTHTYIYILTDRSQICRTKEVVGHEGLMNRNKYHLRNY